MKKVLLASAAFVMTAGVAAADITLNGNGRMGVIEGFGSDELVFTSRIRFNFAASGETDGGLAFGGSLASDDSGDSGESGEVYVSGDFGRLAMGDTGGAAAAAVGQVDGVGLTGLGDLNEITYIADSDLNPTALYSYEMGDFAFYASAGQQATGDDEYALGMTYAFGDFGVALGYENDESADDRHIILGLSADVAGATFKVVYGDSDILDSGDQLSGSVSYTMDATTFTAFAADTDGDTDFGLGVGYDLGGGAALAAGYAHDDSADDSAWDAGIKFTF